MRTLYAIHAPTYWLRTPERAPGSVGFLPVYDSLRALREANPKYPYKDIIVIKVPDTEEE